MLKRILKKNQSPSRKKSVNPSSNKQSRYRQQNSNHPLDLKPIPEIVISLQPAEEPEPVLELITEEALESLKAEALPWENNTPSSFIDWRFGSIFGVLILIFQLIYFETDDLSQNEAYRPYLEKICHLFGCHLLGYKNLDEFEVIQGFVCNERE